MVYFIHFDEPIGTAKKTAQHYIGFTSLSLDERMARHQTDRGAAILRYCQSKGIGYSVVRTWPEGDRIFENKIKQRGHYKELCPVCSKK